MALLQSDYDALEQASQPTPYVWDRRYAEEGSIWGDRPSPTAIILATHLQPRSKVMELGSGYGRDMRYFLMRGHKVLGIENSIVGHENARRYLSSYLKSKQCRLVCTSDFSRVAMPRQSYDAVFTHRVPHLMPIDMVRKFNDKAARILRPAGLLMVTARNPNDFNPEQMEWIDSGKTAQYKPEFLKRKGQILRFWDHDLFRSTFSRDFDIAGFIDGTEIESQQNPTDTHFTIMIARRKFSEPANNP